MIYLILAIILSTSILICFKLFKKYDISIQQAITVNYLVAAIFGYIAVNDANLIVDFPSKPWFLTGIITGFFFIFTFNIFAYSTQKAGVAITAVSSKISVIIPVLLGFIIFSETRSIYKIIGIIAALITFYLIFYKKKQMRMDWKYIAFPLLLFLGNGINDSLLKYSQYFYIKDDFISFLTFIFSVALIFGILILLIRSIKSKEKINLRSIISGILLGLLNWGSTYYFLVGLDYTEVSVFIPIFNISVVSLSALIGFFIFKEKLTLINWAGVILAIFAIILIASADKLAEYKLFTSIF